MYLPVGTANVLANGCKMSRCAYGNRIIGARSPYANARADEPLPESLANGNFVANGVFAYAGDGECSHCGAIN